MHTSPQSEKGMALMMSLGAIVIIGVLMGGVLFVATQDYRIGGNTVRMTRAAAAADLGLNRVPVAWNLANNQMQTGATVTMAFTAPNGATANVIVTRLGGPFFWAVSEGDQLRVARCGGGPALPGRHAAHRRRAHRGRHPVPGQRESGQLGGPEPRDSGGGVRELLPGHSRAGRLEGHHGSRSGSLAGRR